MLPPIAFAAVPTTVFHPLPNAPGNSSIVHVTPSVIRRCLTHKSWTQIEGDPDSAHMKEIIRTLEQDRRYLILECMQQTRAQILLDYLQELDVGIALSPLPPSSNPPADVRLVMPV